MNIQIAHNDESVQPTDEDGDDLKVLQEQLCSTMIPTRQVDDEIVDLLESIRDVTMELRHIREFYEDSQETELYWVNRAQG